MTGPKARLRLDEAEAELAHLEREQARMRAAAYAARVPQAGAASVDAALSELLGQADLPEAVDGLRADARAPLELRRALLWERRLERARIDGAPEVAALERSLEARAVAFTPEVPGARGVAAVRRVLATAPERERRRAAYAAMAPLARSLGPDLGRLIAMRDDRARAAGHSGYLGYALAHADLTPTRVATFLQAVLRATDGIYADLLADRAVRLGLDAPPAAWDLEYLLVGAEQVMPTADPTLPKEGAAASLLAFLSDHGLDPLTLGITVVASDGPYTNLCVPVDPPLDIRLLAAPAHGLAGHRRLAQALGRALHARFQEPPSPIFRAEPGAFQAAMGDTVAAFLEEPEWFAAQGLGVREADGASEGLRRQRLLAVRRGSVRALCEYALYADRGSDGDEVLSGLEGEILGLDADPTPHWAADAWYASDPLHGQNRVLAAAAACQTARALRGAFGGLYGPRQAMGSLRSGYWRPAATVAWQDKLATVSGMPLATGALSAELGGRESNGHAL